MFRTQSQHFQAFSSLGAETATKLGTDGRANGGAEERKHALKNAFFKIFVNLQVHT
jgi:hypothetical protein